jgi:hypothetical protein
MDVTLKINGRDFSSRLSTYRVEQEITYPDMLTTMDGTEHYGKPYRRDVIYFSLFPFDDDTANQDYVVLVDTSLTVNYTNPQATDSEKLYKPMKLFSNLSSAFGLRSVNGKRYYKGGEIALRSTLSE